LLLGVYHVDKGAALLNLSDDVCLHDVVGREIDDVELDVVVVGNGLTLNLRGLRKEECFMGRHLLEDDLLNA